MKEFIQKIFNIFGLKVINIKKDKSNLEQFYRNIITKNNPVIFDVGANKGQSIKKFRSCFTNPIIHSFEPNQDMKKKLEAQFSNDENIKLNLYGLGDKLDESNYYNYEISAHNSFNKINLNTIWAEERAKSGNFIAEKMLLKKSLQKMDTIDNYCEKKNIKKIDFLKIDTQGYEPNVLKGAEKMLKNNLIDLIELEIIFSDIYGEFNIYDLEKHLIPYGYKLFGNNTYGNLCSDYFWQTEHIYISKNIYNMIKKNNNFKSFQKKNI